MTGWVKLHRKALEGEWFRSHHNLWILWTYLLMRASHKKHTQIVGLQEIRLKPGEFVFRRKQAAEETGLSEQQVRTCLGTLKAIGNLTTKPTNRFSILSIRNWEVYRGEEF